MSRRNVLFFAGLLVAALVVAGFVSQFASSEPDGLEHVAAQEGFADAATEHDLAGSPLANYGGELGTGERWGRTIAGVAGVSITLAVGYVVFRLARKPKDGPSALGPRPDATR